MQRFSECAPAGQTLRCPAALAPLSGCLCIWIEGLVFFVFRWKICIQETCHAALSLVRLQDKRDACSETGWTTLITAHEASAVSVRTISS